MRRISVREVAIAPGMWEAFKIGDGGWVTEVSTPRPSRTAAEIDGMAWAARDKLVVDFPITLQGRTQCPTARSKTTS